MQPNLASEASLTVRMTRHLLWLQATKLMTSTFNLLAVALRKTQSQTTACRARIALGNESLRRILQIDTKIRKCVLHV